MASIQQRPLNHHENQRKIGWCRVLGKRLRETSISSRPRTRPSVLWQRPRLSCSARPWSALLSLFLCQRKREPFNTPLTSRYVAWYRADPGQVCLRCVDSKQEVHTWAFRLLDNWIWIWSVTMRLFVVSQQFLSGCLLKTCVSEQRFGEGRSHLLWNSLQCMIKLLQSKMEGVQQKVPVTDCIQLALSLQAIVLTWRPTRSFQSQGRDN